MTYCVALKLNQGLVFLADTRTNAGVDNVSRVKKQFTWEWPDGGVICMMTAGNLGVTQAVITELDEQLADASADEPSLYTAKNMYEVAQIVGNKLAEIRSRYEAGFTARNVDSGASIIIGGQKKGQRPRLFLVYSAGNFIEATADAPFFQIGEHKYGKPIIDRVIEPDTALQDGVICALLSMDSTLRSNLSVGMPLDLCVLPSDSFAFSQNRRIEADEPTFQHFSNQWSNLLRDAFSVMREMDV